MVSEKSASRSKPISMCVPTGNCLFIVINGNTRSMCKICSKIILKTPGRPK